MDKNELIAVDVCAVCGLPKKDHCEFEARTKPRGCVCDLDSWFCEPGPICDDYQDSGNDGYCKNCEHNKGCHGEG